MCSPPALNTEIQRADLLPTIAATGNATYTNNAIGGGEPVTDIHSYSVDAGFSAFEIDLFGRIRNLSKSALQRYFATEEAQRSTRITLISEIANAWLTLAADQEQLAISRENLKSLEQTRSLTQAQFRIGTASELESPPSGHGLSSGPQRCRGARNADRARQECARSARRRPSRAGTGSGQPSREWRDHRRLAGRYFLGRAAEAPDVLQAEHQLIAENANIGAARAAMFPRISLTAMIGTISTALSGLFSGGSFTYNVSPSISQTIFDFGRNRGNVRLAEANKLAAVASYKRPSRPPFAKSPMHWPNAAPLASRWTRKLSESKISASRRAPFRRSLPRWCRFLPRRTHLATHGVRCPAAARHHPSQSRPQPRRAVPVARRGLS